MRLTIKFLRALLCPCILSVLFTATVFAQTSRGTVSGVVTDPSGAVIQGANVTLTNTATQVERSTVTNAEGAYRFDAVDLGDYSVKIVAKGFGEVTKINIDVKANQIAEVGASMSPAGQQVTIDVTTEAGTLLQTEAPVRGGNIEERRITELPFAARNPVALALTLPGVSSNRFGLGVATFSVNGSRGRSNNFLIDGTENNDISVAGQAFQITNPDAVQEVSVQTSNYDAEFGRAGGAVVNVITKSGANSFHGSLSYLLDSTFDDATSNTQAVDPVVQRRGHPLPGTEQWFAGTVGGPIKKNRTFFFTAYQEQRQSSSSGFTRTVPSAAGVATLRSLYAPGANPRLDTYLGVIGSLRATSNLSTIALGSGRPALEIGQTTYSVAAKFKDQQLQTRIDHKLGEKDQLSGRMLWRYTLANPATSNFPGLETTQQNRYLNLMIAETHVFSPVFTNEARIAYNRINLFFPVDPSNDIGNTLPRYDFQSTQVSSIGVQTNLPQGRVANNYLFQDTVTYLHGNHTFRAGVDILKQRSRQFAPIVERGQFVYNSGGGFTAFANFLDDFGGSGGSSRKDFGSAKYYPFMTRQAYFFQDRWKASESLTLTLGVRYENFGQPLDSLRTSAFTGLFNVDPVTFAGPYSEPNRTQRDNNNFGPTLGLAYSPSYKNGFLARLFGDKQSVIRAGYQVGYDSFFNNIASNAQTSSPNVIATNIASVVTTTAPRGLANTSTSLPTSARPLSPLDGQTLVIANLVNPYYQKWSFGIQRELPHNLLLDVSYVGTKGTKLYINEDLNPSVPRVASAFLPGIARITPPGFTGSQTCTPGAAGCLISGRLDNLQGSRLIRTNGGSSSYHSGQLQLTRRFAKGFTATGAYTYSKGMDNASEVFAIAEVNQPQQSAFPSIFGGQAAERAVSFFDRTHRATITYVYALPWMQEQRSFVGHLLGGWELSGITTFESGVPLTVINGQDSDGVGGGNYDRPLYNPSGQKNVRAQPAVATATVNPCSVAVGAVFYTNPDANGACISPTQAQYIGILAGTGIGNLGRNTLRSPGTNNWNFNILKRTKLGETMRLEFRTEFFNIFNHPQFGQSSVSPFAPADQGIAASVFGSTSGRFLDPRFADGGSRVIRYQLKFTF
jgi:outer membrane receptor protein involved in Fe transport